MAHANAAGTLTLGDQAIEANNQFLGGSLGGCKFRFTGTTGQYSGAMNIYISFAYADLSTNKKGVFGIYDVAAGKKIAVSAQTAGLASGWNTVALIGNFQLVNGAWYWLVTHTPSVFAVAIRTSAYGVGVAGQFMWISTTTKTYDGTLPATLPTFAGTNARIASIYASLVANGTSPPPTNQVTPPSLSPSRNLGVIPDNYDLTYGRDPQIIFLDYGVVHTLGKPSIRIGAHTAGDSNTYRECDGPWLHVKPGDHILLKVWVKTDSSSIPDQTNYGGRVGFDLYASTSAGFGIPCKTGKPDSMAGYPGWYGNVAGSIGAGWRLPWGKGWTMIGWDIIVPSDFYSYVYIGGTVKPCNPVQIESFVPILDVRPVGQASPVWFADAELYINP